MADPTAVFLVVDFLVVDFLVVVFPAVVFPVVVPVTDFLAVLVLVGVFLAGVFLAAVLRGAFVLGVPEAISAFLAPSSPDVPSEGVVLPEGRCPEGSPPPRRVFFVAISRV
ncbi:MAG: hypothetical protein CMJ52_09750 [Planctomycetaceae bacterium]|nr:hypothetical protein [Planctomycetaceae bacterium]